MPAVNALAVPNARPALNASHALSVNVQRIANATNSESRYEVVNPKAIIITS